MAAFLMFLLIIFCGVASAEEYIGEGTLKIAGDNERPYVCPLKHTEVQASISGVVGKVTVSQKFENPINDPIEAEYIFPLPEDAAVDSMTMKIGSKIVKAEIKERQEAEKIYSEAKKTGRRTALLNQERPNIFKWHIANIMPRDEIEITLTYVDNIKYSDGFYEFVFPMTVGPRFIPKDGFTECLPVKNEINVVFGKDVNYEHTSSNTDNINPEYPPEGMRSGHDISLEVLIETPCYMRDIKSILHKTKIQKINDRLVKVSLSPLDNIPNKDFVLRYSFAEEQIEEGILCYSDGQKDGFFFLILQPPKKAAVSQTIPKELIFIVDTSGSQSGKPLEKVKETMKYAIEGMNPNDTFNIMAFSNKTISLFPKPRKNALENRKAANDFMESRLGTGGTYMMPAILEALQAKEDPDRLRIVCVMTDGYIGNDMEVIDAVKENIGNARLFSFGTGNGVNRFLIENLAKAGRGDSEIITLSESGREYAESFYDKLASPLLTDIEVDWGELSVSEIYPQRAMDLFSSKPLIFSGRYDKSGNGTITLYGKAADGPFVKKINVDFPEKALIATSIPVLWARMKIEDIMRSNLSEFYGIRPDERIKNEIVKTALEFGLATQFTSFVAVEEKIVNKNGKSEKISVPAEMPEGVEYAGIFGSSSGGSAEASVAISIDTAQVNSLRYSGNTHLHTVKPIRKVNAPGAKFDKKLTILKEAMDSGWTVKPSYEKISQDDIQKYPKLNELRNLKFKNGKIRVRITYAGSLEAIEDLCGKSNAKILDKTCQGGSQVLFVEISPDALWKIAKKSGVTSVVLVEQKERSQVESYVSSLWILLKKSLFNCISFCEKYFC